MIGQRFGKWMVTGTASPDKKSIKRWTVLCDCGVERPVRESELRNGRSKSCGCWRSGLGLSDQLIYQIWASMIQRCSSENNPNWHRYGGRGIKVCENWKRFSNFYADMGLRPEGMSLDRIDNDGDYSPKNCRWATRKAQANNRRNTTWLEYHGVALPLGVWASLAGIKSRVLRGRIGLGWSMCEALNTPVGVKRASTESFTDMITHLNKEPVHE